MHFNISLLVNYFDSRYPTDEHLLDSGLITKEELDLFKTIHVRVDPHQVTHRLTSEEH